MVLYRKKQHSRKLEICLFYCVIPYICIKTGGLLRWNTCGDSQAVNFGPESRSGSKECEGVAGLRAQVAELERAGRARENLGEFPHVLPFGFGC